MYNRNSNSTDVFIARMRAVCVGFVVIGILSIGYNVLQIFGG